MSKATATRQDGVQAKLWDVLHDSRPIPVLKEIYDIALSDIIIFGMSFP